VNKTGERVEKNFLGEKDEREWLVVYGHHASNGCVDPKRTGRRNTKTHSKEREAGRKGSPSKGGDQADKASKFLLAKTKDIFEELARIVAQAALFSMT